MANLLSQQADIDTAAELSDRRSLIRILIDKLQSAYRRIFSTLLSSSRFILQGLTPSAFSYPSLPRVVEHRDVLPNNDGLAQRESLSLADTYIPYYNGRSEERFLARVTAELSAVAALQENSGAPPERVGMWRYPTEEMWELEENHGLWVPEDERLPIITLTSYD